MFGFSVQKDGKVRQLFRLGAVASLAYFVSLGVRAQIDSTTRVPLEPRASEKSAETAQAEQTFTLVGAGDIASCQHLQSAEATARLIAPISGTVFAAGDLAYEQGSPDQFRNCYDKTWGEFKDRTKPALGNHEYGDPAATGYFEYWGAQAGPAGRGYYSYDLGDWHIVVLNTNCDIRAMGGCDRGSPQETWLRHDLAKYPDACILAYGHHPLFSSGVFKRHALHPGLRPFWEDLYAAHADLVLAAHEHSYERFAPQDPQGNPDPARGIREIVVGTGGRSHSPLGVPTANSEVRDWTTYGVLRLTLARGKYHWEFVPVEGQTFHDSGDGACHNVPSPGVGTSYFAPMQVPPAAAASTSLSTAGTGMRSN